VALADARRFDEAISALQDVAAIHRETGDLHGEGMALTALGVALRAVRRFDEAISACQDAATIFRETGDLHGERVALKNLESAQAAVARLPTRRISKRRIAGRD
jgi:tetratricopeptide (TPR) repeat protein